MESPFPGMDPYIEACDLWHDFHPDFLHEIKRAVAEILPERYVARTGAREYGARVEVRKPGAASVFVEDFVRERYINILNLDRGERLATRIEVLSPANKQLDSKGRDLYLRKRQALLGSSVHFVEIDLLRAGSRMPAPCPLPSTPYYVLACRKSSTPQYSVWPAGFRQPLPTIRIPLDEPDADLPLDLQHMVEAVFDRNRYAQSIDYSRPLTPPLEGEELAWLQERLAARQPSP